jgi:chromosome segregation ATPase
MDIKIAQQMTITELVLENQKLKQERDEARGEQCSIQCAFEESQDKIEELERERDEAQSELSLKQQTFTIAEGTLSDLRKQRDEWAAMCGRYKQERDEAREDAAHCKAEYEIVEARLCGWKHPRDNGIIFGHEVIPRLEAKIAQLEGKTARPEPLWYNQREIPADIKEEVK